MHTHGGGEGENNALTKKIVVKKEKLSNTKRKVSSSS